MDNFDPNNVLLSIATNIPVLLMTAFVLQDQNMILFDPKLHGFHTVANVRKKLNL